MEQRETTGKRIRRKSQASELLEGSNPMKKQLGI
jgi:hypothetical protein